MATTTETRTEALGTRPQRPQINRSPKGPSNFTSVVYGYDEPNWVSSYAETHSRGVCTKAYRPPKERLMILPNQLFHKSREKYLNSTFQESYSGYKPETTAAIYKTRKDEFDRTKYLLTLDSVLRGEEDSLNDVIHIPKSTMTDDYRDRQKINKKWPAVQNRECSNLPPIKLRDNNEPQSDLTETAHQYQWPREHPSDIYQVLYKRFYNCK